MRTSGVQAFFLRVVLLAVGASCVTAALAAEPDKPSIKQPEPASSTVQPAPGWPVGKTVAFEMRDKSWGSVLEWLSEQTGLPVNWSSKPPGTFNHTDPKGKRYTLPE